MLRHVETARVFRLRPRTTIGRGPGNVMRLSSPRASGEHAVIAWSGDGWRIRDLGSRNGTWVDGVRLMPGQTLPLPRGARLAFGAADDRWQLIDDAPPRLFAEAVDDGAVVDAIGGVLALPSSEDPRVMVFESGDDFTVEEADGARPGRDRDVVVVAGRAWRLTVPESTPGTLTDQAAHSRGGLGLRLVVSADRRFIELHARRDGDWLDLGHRAHHGLLLALAEERLADGDATPGEQGWVHLQALAERLGHDPRTINVHICRLRQQLGQAGIADAAGLIERRAGTGQIRLGTAAVEIRPQ